MVGNDGKELVKMARFERIDGVEYAIREGVTADDPLGAILYSRWERSKTAKVQIGGERKTYEELLDEFEKGEMTREVYETLSKRFRPKSMRDELDERAAKRILRMDLISYLFGNPESFNDKWKRELTKASVSVGPFREFIKPYLKEKVGSLPNGFEGYKEEIINAAERKRLIELEKILGRLRNALHFRIDYDFFRNVNKVGIHGDNESIEKYRNAYANGSVFALGDVLTEFRKKYPN